MAQNGVATARTKKHYLEILFNISTLLIVTKTGQLASTLESQVILLGLSTENNTPENSLLLN